MRSKVIEEGIDASPLGSVLVEYLRGLSPNTRWSPSATHMYETLTNKAGDRTKSQAWPRTPRGMGTALKRIAPNLRAIGITYTREENHDRLYRFVVNDIVQSPKNAPHPPHSPQPGNGAGYSRGTSGAEGKTGADCSTPSPASAPTSAPPEPSNDAGPGERGGWGNTSDDCTSMSSKQFNGSQWGRI